MTISDISNNKKTIMFYINTIGHGGAERVILQLAEHFAKTGYNSILVTSFVDKGNENPVPEEVVRIPLEKEGKHQSFIKKNITRIKKLRKLCVKYNPAVLISFMGEPNFRSVLATKGLKTKTIISVRSDPHREYGGFVRKILAKRLLPKADGCVFQTEDQGKFFPVELQNKSKVIFNEVSEKFFNTNWNPQNYIVTLGRLENVKNHKLLISSFNQIKSKFSDVNLFIYGEGNIKNELHDLIERLQLKDRVILKGQTDSPDRVLSNAKCFVLSSNQEGMPNALMEALAVGVPCISTDCPCGGPRSLIKNGENGILVPVGDVDAMAEALDKVLSNQEYAAELGRKGKESSKRFLPNVVFQQWNDYVEGIIS
jgi:glycosyltransferase involved in cell wall biosynthesis